MECRKINELCTPMVKNIKQKDLSDNKLLYPVYGASGLAGYTDTYVCDKEYVGVVKDGSGVGRTNIYPANSSLLGTMQHILPNDNVNCRYLMYAITHLKLGDTFSGAAIPHIYFKDYGKLSIKYVPLEKQINIANELHTIESAITHKNKSLTALDNLIKSRFIEMFGDPITNERGWEQKSIDSMCVNIFGGGTPSKSCSRYFEGKIPWVTPKDMKSKLIFDSIDHITQEAVDNSSTKIIPPHSVLMVIRSGILKHSLPVAINAVAVTLNQDMKAFIPSDKITASFLSNYFTAIEDDILYGVRCVTADNIDFKAFKKRMMIVPPISLQNAFADFVKLIDKSKFVCQVSLSIFCVKFLHFHHQPFNSIASSKIFCCFLVK